MSKIVYVEKDDCTACNQCIDNLPKYFRADDDGLAESHVNGETVNAAPVEDADESLVQAEIDACPGECIHWK
jgi:ferredoxin